MGKARNGFTGLTLLLNLAVLNAQPPETELKIEFTSTTTPRFPTKPWFELSKSRRGFFNISASERYGGFVLLLRKRQSATGPVRSRTRPQD